MSVTAGLCAVSSDGPSFYHFVNDPKNLAEAQRHCREEYTHLATTDNMKDVNIFNDMVDLSKLPLKEHKNGIP